MDRLAFAEDAADVGLALVDGDAGCHDDFDVEVLWEYEFFLFFHCRINSAAKIHTFSPMGENFCLFL